MCHTKSCCVYIFSISPRFCFGVWKPTTKKKKTFSMNTKSVRAEWRQQDLQQWLLQSVTADMFALYSDKSFTAVSSDIFDLILNFTAINTCVGARRRQMWCGLTIRATKSVNSNQHMVYFKWRKRLIITNSNMASCSHAADVLYWNSLTEAL